MAIATALQLEADRATPALSRFNYNAMPSLTSLNLSISVLYSAFAANTLLYAAILTFDPVTLTFVFEHLQRIVCDVVKLCTIFERNWTISDGVIVIFVFDLEHVLSVAVGSGIIFTKFDLRQLIGVWIIAFLMLVRNVKHKLWPWPLTSWPWKFVVHQMTRDQSPYEIWAKSSNSQLN